ncbi:FAD-linked oxidoreductase [Lizonia empirigonia]|nr:FAD-linked oxidoreductase [Lizonia empirigonia]
MPLAMFLRSFIVATISSKKWLLVPSLHVLEFFSKPDRTWIFNLEKNPVLKAIIKKSFYDHFCAGTTPTETKVCVKALKALGFRGVILTYAQEIVFDHKSGNGHNSGSVAEETRKEAPGVKLDNVIESWKAGTLGTIDLIEEGDILAIKTSGAGPTVVSAFNKGELPPQQMLDALSEIGTKCKERNIQVIVDAESQQYQKGIARVALEMMRKFNTDGRVVVYNTYQAYLKETQALIASHLAEAEKDGFTLGLKLVRGAYIASEDRSLIHDTKQDTDDSYNGISHGVLRQQLGEYGVSRPFPSVNLFLASHNRESVISAQRLHEQRTAAGLPTVPVSFGQLQGMSDEVSFSLLAEKGNDGQYPEVFKCSTWGSMGDCIGLLSESGSESKVGFDKYIACVRSEASEKKLAEMYSDAIKSGKLSISRGDNIIAAIDSDVLLLGVDPSDVEATLKQDGLSDSLSGKLLISLAAGWTRADIETLLSTSKDKIWVVRTLPNIAAQVSESLTTIENPDKDIPKEFVEITDAIFNQVGKIIHVDSKLMNASTAVGGSTPAMFAVICDALIDASVAVGMPRGTAQTMIYQSMRGTAAMLQSGIHPGVLKDQGTSPEGCTIGGLMVMEEGGVRGHLGKALREAVTIARLMGRNPHVNDTRQGQ